MSYNQIQIRRQGGSIGFARTPFLASKRLLFIIGPLASLLLRMTTVEMGLVAAMLFVHEGPDGECRMHT